MNNRKSNLRIIDIQKNVTYRSEKNRNNKSGYRNVCFLKDYNKWVVQLMVDGKNTRLGFFDDVHKAGEFAEQMRQKHYKEYAGNT